MKVDNMKCFDKNISIDENAKSLGVKLGVTCLTIESIWSEEHAYLERFLRELEQVSIVIKNKLKSLDEVKNHPVVRAYRDFFWKIGIDPTKTRPAGEALARRLFSQKKFNHIHPIVDAGNLASALTMISIGIYDSEKIPGNLRLTLSRGGETFYPIGGDVEILREDIPVLVSGETVIHLFPHRDSVLTSVDRSTKNIIAISAGVPGIDDSLLLESLKTFIHYLGKLNISYHIVESPNIVV